MSKRFFIKIVTSPDVDPLKVVVGMSCAARAIEDGHTLDVFFAGDAVQLLHAEYIADLDERIDVPAGMCWELLEVMMDGANGIYCSTASQAAFGVTQEDGSETLVKGLDLHWSGPPGVIALAADAEVTMVY